MSFVDPFEDVRPRGVPVDAEVVEIRVGDEVFDAFVYRHYETWAAATVSQPHQQTWYGIGLSRDEAVDELTTLMREDLLC